MKQNQVSCYRNALLTKKIWKRSAIKAQQIFKTLVHNATSAMHKNKKLKCKATSAIAEVALCPPPLTLDWRWQSATHKREAPRLQPLQSAVEEDPLRFNFLFWKIV